MKVENSISVIICAYTEDRWNDLIAAVESVQQQTLPAKEIIIVVDHNPGLLKRVQDNLPGVVAVDNLTEKGLSGARNTGVVTAYGAVVAFLDDDAIAAPNWLESLAICYDDPNVVGVGGKIEPLWVGTRPSWFLDEFNWVVGCTYRGMPTKNAPVRNVIGANMSARRHVLTTIGGFRESFGCNKNESKKSTGFKRLQQHAGDEETEFCIRVTQQWPDSVWLYTTSAAIQHRVPVQRTRLAYFLWRCYDEGWGKAMLVRLHGAHTGLSSERTYTLKVLPQGIVRGLTDAFFHRDLTGLARAGAIVIGLTMAVAGYLVGSIYLKIADLRNTATTSVPYRYTSKTPLTIETQQQGKEK